MWVQTGALLSCPGSSVVGGGSLTARCIASIIMMAKEKLIAVESYGFPYIYSEVTKRGPDQLGIDANDLVYFR